MILENPVVVVFTSTPASFNQILLREAQSHFERAKMLDPHNIVAQGFIEKVLGYALNSHI